MPYQKDTLRGAWAEAVAAAWLMERDWEVYGGLGGCEELDLIACRRGTREMVRVEVKVGTPIGAKYQIQVKDHDVYYMLLVVLPDGTVLQDPTSAQVCGARRLTGFSECRNCGSDAPLRARYCSPECRRADQQENGAVA